MTEAETDHGTVLEKGSAAIMVDIDGRWSLLIPKMKSGDLVSRQIRLLTCMFVMAGRDEEWGNDLIEEVEGSVS